MKRYTHKRRHIRFGPESDTIVQVSLNTDVEAQFKPDHFGLAIDESFGGVGAVFVQNRELTDGRECIVKSGKLSPIKAKVVWLKHVDAQIIKIGLEYENATE